MGRHFLVGRRWFNAVDGHPLLAPLIGAWMTWLMAGTGLLIDGADGLSGRTLLLVNLGGSDLAPVRPGQPDVADLVDVGAAAGSP